jgi:hypothetical protein
MRIQGVMLQLVALLILASSACDFCAFDLYDPGASMSCPGPLSISLPAARASDLPDDHCLCCSASIPSPAVTLASPWLISSEMESSAVQAPIPEGRSFEQPPRA